MTLTLAEVLMVVCRVMDASVQEMRDTGRHDHTVRARRVFVALCRGFTDASYPDIVEFLGRRRTGHSTAIAQHDAFVREYERGDAATVEAYTRCWLEARKVRANKMVRVVGEMMEEAA